MNKQPVSYLQIDPEWKNKPYAVKGESSTIGGSGCGPTAMAMVLATWADSRVTPGTECAWALKNGFKAPHSGTYYSYFVPAARRYGLACTQLNGASIYGNAGSGLHAQVLSFLAQGDLIIACMGKGNWTKSGHYVLLWDVQGDTAYVNDPASTLERRTRGSWALFRRQVKFYWRIRRPNSVPLNKGDEPMAMTAEEIRTLVEETVKVTMKNWIDDAVFSVLNKFAEKPEPDWSQQEGRWEDAVERGLTDGTRPCALASRVEVMTMISRALEKQAVEERDFLERLQFEENDFLDKLRKAVEAAGIE